MASPIETMLLNALLSNAGEQFGFWYGERFYGNDQSVPCEVISGAAVGSYRVDFLININGNDEYRLAVECDGHDFHDRTKQQAAYDRARDRELLALGVFTIRFTGSEIHHSPERCVSDLLKCLAFVEAVGNLQLVGWMDGYQSGIESVANPRPGKGL